MSARSGRPRRDLDAESGMRRVSRPQKKGKKPAPPPSSDEEEDVYVHSDLESELEMPAKDDSVRKKKKPQQKKKTPRIADHGVEGEEDSGSELAEHKAKETSSSIAPHMAILLAATYHLGFASIVRPAVSTYFPDASNMYTMALAMMDLVSENTYLNEICPSFFSVGFYCYIGYLYFYQILRAKDEVGHNQLSREERRVLRSLKTLGEPENWPVPSPLIPFVQALGYYKSSNPQYSYVVPSIPDLTQVSRAPGGNSTGYAQIDGIAGFQRIPPVSAYAQFLRLFGNRTASFNAAQGWIPTAAATLAGNNTFMTLNNSGVAAGPFQTLAFSGCWNSPTEGEMRWGPVQAGTKRQTIRRWNIPDFSVVNINGLETFLGVQDGQPSSWIRHLIPMTSAVCRFFPGSTTLAAINPLTNIGSITPIKIESAAARTAVADKWYHGRTHYVYEYRGYDDTEQGRILTRIGIATCTNSETTANIYPIGTIAHGRLGPFFEDDAANPDTERFERFVNEGETEADPVTRFAEQLSVLYDSAGGRK